MKCWRCGKETVGIGFLFYCSCGAILLDNTGNGGKLSEEQLREEIREEIEDEMEEDKEKEKRLNNA